MKQQDRGLGMDCDITRRDFLTSVNIAVTGSLLSTPLTQALAALEESAGDVTAQMMPGYYPPTREGLRGSHPGSFEVAHSLRNSVQWNNPHDSELIGIIMPQPGVNISAVHCRLSTSMTLTDCAGVRL